MHCPLNIKVKNAHDEEVNKRRNDRVYLRICCLPDERTVFAQVKKNLSRIYVCKDISFSEAKGAQSREKKMEYSKRREGTKKKITNVI